LNAVRLPSAFLRRDGVQFSFSGLKTALLYAARGVPGTARRPAPPVPALTPERVRDLAASFQHAAVASIIEGLDAAIGQPGERPRTLLVGGGVSANQALRAALDGWATTHGLECRVPMMAHCIDNAAMIAGLAALMPAPSGLGDLGFVAEPMSRIARGARGPQRKAS
jgi:N6-L-threonylcarbamoyladenine synthase